MTEVSAVGTHAEVQPGPVHVPSPLATLSNGGGHLSEAELPDDPSSTIKCICGYNDDDGNTVLCEICNTWQHIECYYPDQNVPDIHECLDDRPRILDAKGARERQTHLRELQHPEDKRPKRPKSSTHRKKTKDSISINGWPNAEQGVERLSDGIRDQQPPAKRPKTSHKSTASVASINNSSAAVNARRKPGLLGHGQSPLKSPPEYANGYSGDYFSPEFMRLHHRPPYQHADGNFMTSIGVTNDLAAWVQDPDELAKVTRGEPPSKVFSRIDTAFGELEAMCPGISRHAEEDKSILINGAHPVIQRLTVDSATPQNAFIGELRGHISRRDDYIQNRGNRWSTLRHPEPFVFFPPYLPIVLDARDEGTELRYIRRSCKPNTKMRIIIDKARDYHFCLVSEFDINEGEEITLGWHLDGDVMHILATLTSNGSLKKEGIHGPDEQFICDWASRVLANFGGCACGNPGNCLLGRFDRRANQHLPDFASSALKLAKGRKGKRFGNHASPLSTGRATNSRASSETAITRNDVLDDHADSRSASGSSKSKPTSRDNTPGMVSTEPEISIREKRKLEQLERRFDALGQDETPARKKKRNSAGSSLNTPGIGSLKQLGLGLGLIDSHNISPPLIGSAKANRLNSPNGPHVHHAQRNSRQARSDYSPVQTRMYVEASTQTDIGAQNNYNTALAPRKKRRITYSQRLLARTRDEKPKAIKVEDIPPRLTSPWNSEAQHTAGTQTTPLSNPVGAECVSTMLPPPRPSFPLLAQDLAASTLGASLSATGSEQDVAMQDVAQLSPSTRSDPRTALMKEESVTTSGQRSFQEADVVEKATLPEASETTGLDAVIADSNTDSAAVRENEETETRVASGSTRPRGLHVTLPPVPNFPSPTPTTPSVTATPDSITGSAIAQSPLSTTAVQPPAPLISPVVQSAVAPSPLKKKLSLSDYTSRKRAAAKEAAAQTPTTSSDAKQLHAVTEDSAVYDGIADGTEETVKSSQAEDSITAEEASSPTADPIDESKQEAADEMPKSATEEAADTVTSAPDDAALRQEENAGGDVVP